MLDLSANNCIHRILVPIPILTAPVDHSTVGTFNYISKQIFKKHYHMHLHTIARLEICHSP